MVESLYRCVVKRCVVDLHLGFLFHIFLRFCFKSNNLLSLVLRFFFDFWFDFLFVDLFRLYCGLHLYFLQRFVHRFVINLQLEFLIRVFLLFYNLYPGYLFNLLLRIFVISYGAFLLGLYHRLLKCFHFGFLVRLFLRLFLESHSGYLISLPPGTFLDFRSRFLSSRFAASPLQCHHLLERIFHHFFFNWCRARPFLRLFLDRVHSQIRCPNRLVTSSNLGLTCEVHYDRFGCRMTCMTKSFASFQVLRLKLRFLKRHLFNK
mmetsp:Transcript_11644/g.19100  ORF Transcript_11644/g.19100 Transcript_11644/m.19100 type:complete len:262 (-) Transcript_11644:527-1312(-)